MEKSGLTCGGLYTLKICNFPCADVFGIRSPGKGLFLEGMTNSLVFTTGLTILLRTRNFAQTGALCLGYLMKAASGSSMDTSLTALRLYTRMAWTSC